MAHKGLTNRTETKFKLFDKVVFNPPSGNKLVTEIVSTINGKGTYLIKDHGPAVSEKYLERF